MAKRNVYREKSRPFLTLLYIAVALALVAALAMMYMKDRDRRRQFSDMVREAMSDEVSLDIASLKARQTEESDEADPVPDETEPTPTAEPAPTTAPEAESEASLPDIYLPEPEQVEEAISEE